MPRNPNMTQAPKEYTRKEENLFRKHLEANLIEIVSFLFQMASGALADVSLSNKRNAYNPPVGSVTLT